MRLAYWTSDHPQREGTWHHFVDGSATLRCEAAMGRRIIPDALRQARRQYRRDLVARGEALGHSYGSWQPFTPFCQSGMSWEKVCTRCKTHILVCIAPYETAGDHARGSPSFDALEKCPAVQETLPGLQVRRVGSVQPVRATAAPKAIDVDVQQLSLF